MCNRNNCRSSPAVLQRYDAFLLLHGAHVEPIEVPFLLATDWTAIFAQELTLIAARQFHDAEPYQGKTWRAFDLAIELMSKGKLDLGWMISRKYLLADYKRALSDLAQKGSRGIIKAAFEFRM